MRLVAPVPADEDAAVTMAQGRSRPAWAEIDLAAVAHNAAVLARLAAPAELCAVVKAHGYGHGGPAVARAALAGGAGRLAVALVDEGVELREHGVTAPVLLLSECDPAAAGTALSYGLTPTLYSAEGIARLRRRGRGAAGRPVAVHVKVDTGMHRVGAAPEDLRGIAAAVRGEPLLRLEGMWTHLPRRRRRAGRGPRLHRGPARPLRPPRGRPGRRRHHGAAAARRQHGGRRGLPPLAPRHGALRARPLRLPPGPTGRDAFDEQAGGERLRPAMALKARVVAVRTLEAGERPSYGRLRPLPARSLVATVPIGYADGVPRRLFDGGYEVLIGGVRRPLAGAVTMDQIVVDCGDDDSVRPGRRGRAPRAAGRRGDHG